MTLTQLKEATGLSEDKIKELLINASEFMQPCYNMKNHNFIKDTFNITEDSVECIISTNREESEYKKSIKEHINILSKNHYGRIGEIRIKKFVSNNLESAEYKKWLAFKGAMKKLIALVGTTTTTSNRMNTDYVVPEFLKANKEKAEIELKV